MAEFVWYHVQGHNANGYFMAERFENIEDAYEFYGKDEDWQDLDFTAELFFPDHREYEVIKRIGW